MGTVNRKILRDSADVDIAASGWITAGEALDFLLADPGELAGESKALKLTGLFHSIESGLVLLLYWEHTGGDVFIMPIEGRGTLDLSRFGGIENPRGDGWTGRILLRSKAPCDTDKYFALTFEFSKQRS